MLKIRIFRAVSFPFYLFYNLLYGLVFKIWPLGSLVFAIEGKPRKYRGPSIVSGDCSLLKNGDLVLCLHLRRKVLMKILADSRPRERIIRELKLTLVRLKILARESKQNFSAFVGETTIVFPEAERFGFMVTPKNSAVDDFLASLQQIYFEKKAKRFSRKKVLIYSLDRSSLLG